MCPPPVATTSDNRLRNCPIGAQRLECDDDSKQAIGVLPISNSLYWVELARLRRPLFCFHKFWHTKTHLLTDAFHIYIYYVSDDVTYYINYRRHIYFLSSYLSTRYKTVKVVILCKFSQTWLKAWIVRFILRHPVDSSRTLQLRTHCFWIPPLVVVFTTTATEIYRPTQPSTLICHKSK